jgi:predicted dehydrogenase
MEKTKVAIVGLGRIASLLEDDALREKPCTHAGAFGANGDCVLVGGADMAPERRSLFAQRRQCAVYADAAAMLAEQRPDILVVATQPESHERFCALAAEHRAPVVVCEKPVADTLKAAERIARLHESGKVKIIVNHERRYAADYNRAKAILQGEGGAGGRLGGILSVKAAICMGQTRKLLNVLWDDATHLADIAMFLTDAELVHRQTFGARLSEKTGTAFLLGYLERNKSKPACNALLAAGKAPQKGDTSAVKPSAKAIPFMLEIGAERDHLIFGLEISCEYGRVRIGNGVFEVWESGPSPYAENFRSLSKTADGFEGKTGFFANMAADAVACARAPRREPVSSALDALRVIRYFHSIENSIS